MAAVVISDEILAELNGAIYQENAQGETRQAHPAYTLIFDQTVDASNQAAIASANAIDGDLAQPIVVDADQARAFMIANAINMKTNTKTAANHQKYSDEQLMELAAIKFLVWRNRIAFLPANLTHWHVSYVDVQGSQNSAAGQVMYDLIPGAVGERDPWVTLVNGQVDHIKNLAKNLSNIICTVAYVFRTRGHHYLPELQEVYTNLWAKCRTDRIEFKTDWEAISTIALHCVMPLMLDWFWVHCASKSKISPALSIRMNAPAAGTAAVFSILAGWRDIRSTYGRAFQFAADVGNELEQMYDHLLVNRWDHSINATLYGANTSRLVMDKYHQIAAIVYGVYSSLEAEGTLSRSKSLVREAGSAPLLQDIATQSAKTLRRQIAESLLVGGTLSGGGN